MGTSYYRLLNEGVKERLGGLHSAKVCLYSVDFAEIEKLQVQGEWEQAGQALAEAALKVQAGGADGLLLCTNTMHKVAPAIESVIDIPLLHIADATGRQLQKAGVKKVGLLGTAFTMEQDFYKGRLAEQFGFEVLVPDAEQRQTVHQIIYEELCKGVVREPSCDAYISIIQSLQQQGAEAIILGCTEIGLLVQQENVNVPLYDTTAIHAEAAVDWALEGENTLS